MSALENFFKQIGVWDKEKEDTSKWEQYMATAEIVEEFAHTHLNMDPATRNEDGSLTAENLLCSSCSPISDLYRFGDYTKDVEFIEEAMKKYKTSAPVILFRGVSSIPFEKMNEAAKNLNDDEVGFYEKGYMSCSLIKECASPYKVQLIIYVPPFTHVMYAGHCNDAEESRCRYECIIMRGAKLNIVKREKNTYYCRLISTE